MNTNTELYRRGRHVVHRLSVHLVFVTKYRRGAINDQVQEVLIQTAEEVCERHGASLLAADGEDDHLHLLVQFPPKLSITTLVLALKTNTSRVVRSRNWDHVSQHLWGKNFWSPSYFAETTGHNTLENIRAYIQNQRQEPQGPGRPKQGGSPTP